MEWIKQEGAGFWNPEKEGEELLGEVVSIDDEGEYGRKYLLKDSEGKEVWTPSHKVLQSRMAKVKAGDMVRIVYTHDEPPQVKGHHPTKMYDVFVGKP